METILATMCDQLGQMLVILGAALEVGFVGSVSAWGLRLAHAAEDALMTGHRVKVASATMLRARRG